MIEDETLTQYFGEIAANMRKAKAAVSDVEQYARKTGFDGEFAELHSNAGNARDEVLNEPHTVSITRTSILRGPMVDVGYELGIMFSDQGTLYISGSLKDGYPISAEVEYSAFDYSGDDVVSMPLYPVAGPDIENDALEYARFIFDPMQRVKSLNDTEKLNKML
jgi:hypothetical protein